MSEVSPFIDLLESVLAVNPSDLARTLPEVQGSMWGKLTVRSQL